MPHPAWGMTGKHKASKERTVLMVLPCFSTVRLGDQWILEQDGHVARPKRFALKALGT